MLRNLALVCCLSALIFHPAKAGADWLQDFELDAVTWMTEAAIPGMAIAIVQNKTVIYAKGFGHLSVDPDSPEVDANTVFSIGSCSKAFGAAMVAMIEDQKQLAWSDPVSSHLSYFQMYDPWVNKQFQVQDLLCHRSGLIPYSLFPMLFTGYPSATQVQGIRFKQPSTSFRTAFAYQNHMYVAASKLVEAKTGQSWGDNISDTIFKPLGMTRSVTTQDAVNQMDNVASGHLLLTDGSLSPISPNWYLNYYFDDNALAAGAIRSTANDMAQWMLLNLALGTWGSQQIISTANMQFLQAPWVLIAPWANGPSSPYWGPVSYGGGWQYFGLSPQPLITHDGTMPGFKTSVMLVPGANIGVVILTNIGMNITGNPSLGTRSGVSQKLAFRFYDLYFDRQTSTAELDQFVRKTQEIFEPASSASIPATANKTPALPLKSYCGVYYHPSYGNFTVSLVSGNLVMTMGPQNLQSNLAPAGGNTFWAYMPDVPANYPMYIPVTFAFPVYGGPATMTINTVMGWPQNDVFTRKKH
jgi:CubicO group peptidase (beta-lactamase class C family)